MSCVHYAASRTGWEEGFIGRLRLAYLSYNAFSEGGEQREQHYAEFKEWLMERYAEYGKTNVFFR